MAFITAHESAHHHQLRVLPSAPFSYSQQRLVDANFSSLIHHERLFLISGIQKCGFVALEKHSSWVRRAILLRWCPSGFMLIRKSILLLFNHFKPKKFVDRIPSRSDCLDGTEGENAVHF